jgi:hypothetical protein
MTPQPDVQPRRGTRRVMTGTLLIEVVAPLALFYGLRALGVNQFLALLLGAAVSAINAAHTIVTQRRVGGVTMFVLGTMAFTVVMSFITGDPRVLLIRNGWGFAAMGVGMLLTLFARRPFLYEAARIVFDEDKQQTWAQNWERFPPFRHLLWVCSGAWGGACLIDAGLRVLMAFTLPIDLVPVLDNVLLVVTLGTILIFQRVYGRRYLRRHGLRLRGVQVSTIADTAVSHSLSPHRPRNQAPAHRPDLPGRPNT